MKKNTFKLNTLSKKLDFYFSIMDLIEKGNSLAGIAKLFGISKQRLEYYIEPLRHNQSIVKLGKGVWEINSLNYRKFLDELVKKADPDSQNALIKKIRGHGFIFLIKIPSIPDWSKREKFLEKMEIEYKLISQGQRIKITKGNDKYKVWLCNNSIIIYFPKGKSYFKEFAKNAYIHALYDAKQILVKLENLLGVNLKINKKWNIKVSRHHYALIYSPIADYFMKRGRGIFIRDVYGVLWAMIDNSFGLNEIETCNKETAIIDMDNVILPLSKNLEGCDCYSFLNDYREQKNLMKPSEIQEMVTKTAQNQAIFAENNRSHVEAIRTLNDTIKELSRLVKKNRD
jgi:hypothetical protein